MKAETNVTIVLTGVRVERLDRLRTLLRSEIARYARSYTIDDGLTATKPKTKLASKKGK